MTDEAVKPAVAIGYSIVSNMGGDRQMTVQCFVGEDEADRVVHAKIDRVFRVIDRQRARYEITDIRGELSKQRETLAQFHEDLARTELLHKKHLASLDVQAEELNSKYKAEHEGGYAQHTQSGRTGAYEPKGTAKVNLERITAGVDAIKAERERALAEREQHLEGLQISIQRFEAAIAENEAKIADREALLKGD